MIVLLPVIQFRVDYAVVGGRPYSRFEHLFLRGIEGRLTTLDSLKRELCVHSRLLIEALVTLTEAGWIAVDNEGFALTVEGERSLSLGRVPESRMFRPLHSYLMMERLTGALSRNREFVTERELRDEGYWEKCVKLKPEVHSGLLDEGIVRGFLPMRMGEWISSIGPIFPVRKDGCWFAINVDVKRKRVRGLPHAWEGHLSGRMLEEAGLVASRELHESDGAEKLFTNRRGRSGRLEEDSENRSGDFGVRRPLRIVPEDLLLTSLEHEAYILGALTTAISTVVIVSSFVRVDSLNLLAKAMSDALARGVNIDIVWGYSGQSEGTGRVAIDWLKEFSYRLKAAPGRIRFNRSPANSHIKALLWDSRHGFELCVGSHNWLSSLAKLGDGDSVPPNTSIIMRDKLLAAYAARTIAGLLSHIQGERLSGGRERLSHIAGELESQVLIHGEEESVVDEDSVEVSLVRDLQHESLLQEILLGSRARLLVCSHQLGRVANLRLMAALGRDGYERPELLVAFGGTDLPEEEVAALSAAINSAGGRVSRIPGLHSKILIGDSRCYIGSYNFLSADPFSTASRSRELGVVIEGVRCSDNLWEWFGKFFPGGGADAE